MVSKLTKSSMCIIKKMIFCLPWVVISNLPGFVIIKQPVEYLFFPQGKEKSKEGIQEFGLNKPPLMEEITIPSVTELSNSGICFLPSNGGILSIRFDVETGTLHLPIIGLDMNTEVLLRNLVAYEASVACGPLVFTRYTELMNGIIDSEEDAKILRENGIIMNHLKSDEEVANLWNGMSRAIKLTRVAFLDKVIEDVNKYYNGRMSVKIWRFVKTYVLSSWQFLTLVVVIFILFLMSLQAFCSFFGCNSRKRVNNIR
ncbi:putative UPF0481 protein [Senna tora]|uniref:Putative UPF0481 protein n=1 Tax=Senna tora TaxID=362788 RepID=A0A834SGA6_9FABA|nr:putative UPF0481 protein [Senna tora]